MALRELPPTSKHFGAIHAVNDVSLELDGGQVVGLMGDNGAGKSTLVKVIAGNYPPTHGAMRGGGTPHDPPKADRRAPTRHRDRLSGSGALRQPDRRRQRLPQPRTAQ